MSVWNVFFLQWGNYNNHSFDGAQCASESFFEKKIYRMSNVPLAVFIYQQNWISACEQQNASTKAINTLITITITIKQIVWIRMCYNVITLNAWMHLEFKLNAAVAVVRRATALDSFRWRSLATNVPHTRSHALQTEIKSPNKWLQSIKINDNVLDSIKNA